jgi:hypothetical protein
MHQILLQFFHKIAVESLFSYKGKLLRHGMRHPEKNCGRIVERFCGLSFGRGRIVETLWRARSSGKNRRRIVDFSTTLPRHPLSARPRKSFFNSSPPRAHLQNLSTIFLQFFIVWKNLVHPDWLGEEL